ncbi:MAG: NADH:flavin oxidoreductase [Deltaproteobacteria bacterium]|nr:MAG: NADH:flavin oxidoreductase [Deltaproteobacteria bacterium]
MSVLFEPMRIRNMEMRNRFVRSATYDKFSDEKGHVTDKRIKLFANLADGGVGLIVTGLTYVHPSGQLAAFESSIATDDCIPGLKRLTAAVHDRGAKIAVQLYHTGRENARFLKAKGEQALAPSFVPNDPYFTQDYRQMTEKELWEIIEAFGDAAKRAREAEFDAVQVHAAHAYLLSQFLSPFTNRRDDKWGGSLDNRLRFHREIYGNMRAKVGDDYPLLIKIGVQDGFPEGLEFSEGRQAAELLAQCGFDALEISHGLRGKSYEASEFRTKINSIEREAYFRPWCREVKGLVDVPIMMVGGLRTFELMEEIIKSGDADFISLSRPLIREPGIINEWKSGNRLRPACISCNQCLEALRKGDELRCVQESLREKGEQGQK